MTSSIAALVKTIQDYFKYRNSKPSFVFGGFSFATQFYANRTAIRHHRRKRCCDPIACIVIVATAFLAGLAIPRKSNTCVFNQTFGQWECCKDVINTASGPQCAVGQQVSILVNP